MTDLLEKLDPNGTGKVSLDSFVVGIQSFLSSELWHVDCLKIITVKCDNWTIICSLLQLMTSL